MVTFLKIGSYTAPYPTGYKIEYNDLDSDKTTRNERGYIANRDRLRSNTFKISATFRLKISDLTALASAIEPKTFSVTCFDLTTAKTVTKTMYAGTKSAEIVKTDNRPGEIWVDYSFTLVEC